MLTFFYLIQREMRLAIRFGTDTLGAILFFVLTTALFPLALNPSPQFLQQIAPGVLWVCALLSALLPLDRVFNSELEDGSLEQLLLLGSSAYNIAFAKIVGHWLITGLPLLIAAFPVAIMFDLPLNTLPVFLFCLGIGTATLSLLGGMVASITLGTRRSAILLPLLILPLLTPILIFGTMAIEMRLNDTDFWPHLELLTAAFSAALPICPLIAGLGLKLAVE